MAENSNKPEIKGNPPVKSNAAGKSNMKHTSSFKNNATNIKADTSKNKTTKSNTADFSGNTKNTTIIGHNFINSPEATNNTPNMSSVSHLSNATHMSNVPHLGNIAHISNITNMTNITDMGNITEVVVTHLDENNFFDVLCNDINITGAHWAKQTVTHENQTIVCINKLFLSTSPGCAKIEKQILIYPDCSIKLFVLEEEIDPVELTLTNSSPTHQVKIQTQDALKQFINWFDSFLICPGGPPIQEYESEHESNCGHQDLYLKVWRHNNCSIMLPKGYTDGPCKHCKLLDVNFKRKELRIKKMLSSPNVKLNVLRDIRRDYMLKND